MEPSRPASPPRTRRAPRVRRDRRVRRPSVVAGAGLVAGLTAAPLGQAAAAEPKPSGKELASQAFQLADRVERLTEQYNGLKVRLKEAQTAARAATANSRREQASLGAVRARLSRLAAASYMDAGGPTDPAVTFAASRDPQQVLDRAATLRYLSTQNSTRFIGLIQTMQAADRAFKDAQRRAEDVTVLRDQVDAQRRKVTDAYDEIRGRLVKRDPKAVAKLPVVGDDLGAKALRLAMTKIGDRYVWGAAGPSTFDCSGLVMWAYEQLGVNLPHYTGAQWNAGTHVARDRLRPGDLVFFYPDLHHMGLYVGAGKILHAPHTGDVVKIDSLGGRPFAGAVRIN
ncbi:NlpC/P60 family protein [Spirillospora sp. NPDC049652]